MSVVVAPFYWLECDGCGVKSTEGSDYVAWSQEADAIDDAIDGDWTFSADGQQHHCPDCPRLKCRECDRDFDMGRKPDPDETDMCMECAS